MSMMKMMKTTIATNKHKINNNIPNRIEYFSKPRWLIFFNLSFTSIKHFTHYYNLYMAVTLCLWFSLIVYIWKIKPLLGWRIMIYKLNANKHLKKLNDIMSKEQYICRLVYEIVNQNLLWEKKKHSWMWWRDDDLTVSFSAWKWNYAVIFRFRNQNPHSYTQDSKISIPVYSGIFIICWLIETHH